MMHYIKRPALKVLGGFLFFLVCGVSNAALEENIDIVSLVVSDPNVVEDPNSVVSGFEISDITKVETIIVETSGVSLNCAVPDGMNNNSIFVVYDPNEVTDVQEILEEDTYNMIYTYLNGAVATNKLTNLLVIQNANNQYCYLIGIGFDK